jgi:predicted DNA-binding helix-hairpin-helix protein
VSVNVELARQQDLDALAPGRRLVTIHGAMDRLRDGIVEAHEARTRLAGARWTAGRPAAGRWARGPLPRFAPAGQVTQMVVGADGASDADVLRAAAGLYQRQRLRRVYFGGYVPVEGAPDALPTAAPTGLRERRLYEADWLVRQYGFAVDELVSDAEPDLAPDVDPKAAWALRHPERFPVDVNRASRDELLRVPGLGHRTVDRILAVRPWHAVRVDDLVRLRVAVARALPFLVLPDHLPTRVGPDAPGLRALLAAPAPPVARVPAQLELFAREAA